MEIWVDHFYAANHLNDGVMLYAPYIKTSYFNDVVTLNRSLAKVSEIADRLIGLQFLFEDAYRSREGEECGVDLPDQIERLTNLLLLTTNENRQLFIPSKQNQNVPSLGYIDFMMGNGSPVDYDAFYDYDEHYAFIDLYGARKERTGKDYKRYGVLVQKLAGSRLSELNRGIESMVDAAIDLSASSDGI